MGASSSVEKPSQEQQEAEALAASTGSLPMLQNVYAKLAIPEAKTIPVYFLKIRRDYNLPINVDDDDDPDPEFTAATRASRRSYAEEDDRRRGLGTSGSRSVKQPGIKQALKGVKATAKAAKGAIKGGELASRPFEEVVLEIDVDELLNEEHPLHAWVEMRAEGEIPELHPDDRLVRAYVEDVELEEHVLKPQEVMGLGVSFQDMRIIQYHPINKKEAKGKHKNNIGDMKANKGKHGMIGNISLLIHLFLVPQN
ncbi:hypothetical protein Taro_031824 [Colocasia esculenta]|uniref:Uncharacterized protein n=1 Tax=Colocasia esculenta TaxID=4460 RepID=A0A843VVN1_COLES|nr:hypothetical protein [Colocasia esculenta]